MAGSKSNSLENSILLLIFNNTDIADLGDASGVQGSAADGSLYIRLFNTDTVDDSTVGTEATYTGYVSGGVAIARTVGGFTVVDNNVTNAAQFAYGECTVGTETLRYFGVFKDNSTGTESHRLYWGQLPSDLIVSIGSIPTIPAGYLNVNEN